TSTARMFVWPRRSRSATRCPPMNPPAPATRIRSFFVMVVISLMTALRSDPPLTRSAHGQGDAGGRPHRPVVDRHQGVVVGLGRVPFFELAPRGLPHLGQCGGVGQ